MASCTTGYWDANSSTPRVRLTVTQSSETGSTATLAWTLQYIASYAVSTSIPHGCTAVVNGTTVFDGSYAISGKTGTHTIDSGTITVNKGTASKDVSFSCSMDFSGITWSGKYAGSNKTASGSIAIDAKDSYTVTYNANGGTGAPSSQTKWHGTALTLSTTKPTRTGYSFQGWSTANDSSVEYAAGASYTANAAVTLYAVWKANTYAVKYNANGGTGAPANQTKTYGVTLKLSSTIPTRTNYNFLGWGTTASSTTVSYAAGANYTANAAITLYAIWELAYVKPRIYSLSVSRCNADGTESEEGTCALVKFDWECDQSISEIKIAWESASDAEVSVIVAASGTSGSVSEIVGDSKLNTDSTYSFDITVTDSNGYTVAFGTLNGTKFSIDFLAGGDGVAIGKPAELAGIFEVALKTKLTGGLSPIVLEPDTDLNEIRTPNTYTGENISSYNYVNCPVTSGTFTLLVESCGEAGQVKQTYTSCSKYKPERYSRFYYQDEWGDWFWANTDEYVLYENDDGISTTITLNAALSHFRYIEIYFTDNNGKTGGYTKVYKPDGKTICLQISEANGTAYSRQTMYTASGTTLTPNITNAGYYTVNTSSAVKAYTNSNLIKIVRVIGRA